MPRPLRTRLAAGIAVGLIAALPAGCSDAPTSTSAVSVISPGLSSGYSGVELDRPYAKPPVELTDTDGKPYSLVRDTTAPVTLVFFGYTNCRDVCSAVLADAATALRRSDAGLRERVRVVFVTTDPARDTGRVIRRYLDRFDPSFVGLTGPMPRIEEAAQALGIALTGTTALPSGGYDVGHSAQLVGFGPDGLAHLVWLPDRITVPGLREDLRRLAGPA